MKQFPDESVMPKSENGDEVIRGGSIGLNRILNRFVAKSSENRQPEFTAVIISAFTIIRNVDGTTKNLSIADLEKGFVTDVNLFLEYYDIYLAHTKSALSGKKFAPVVIYFPDYKRVEKELLREQVGNKAELLDKYKKFLSRYNGKDELVKKLEHVRCFWIRAGDATYPHKEVARKFREINTSPESIYYNGDPIALISHIPLDYHIGQRLRNVHLLESYTGELKGPDQFRFRLDKEGRIPFNTVCHVVFGDSTMIKPMVTPKVRKVLFEQAVKERWVSRTEDDLRTRIAKTADIPLKNLRRYDFV